MKNLFWIVSILLFACEEKDEDVDTAADDQPVLDSDNDGVPDNEDAFPNDPNESVDSDGDGIGDRGVPVGLGDWCSHVTDDRCQRERACDRAVRA